MTTRENTRAQRRNSPKPSKEGPAKRKFIPATESFAEWQKDPEYAAYAELEDEFALASAPDISAILTPE